MSEERTPHIQFSRESFVNGLFSEVFGEDWEKQTNQWNSHGELFEEITRTLYGRDEKNHDRWRSESSVVNEVGHLISFAICLVAGEFLVDAGYGWNMQLKEQQAAYACAKRAGVQAADIARRVSNSNPELFKLFQKRLREYEELLKRAKIELDARIAAAGKQNTSPDDSK